MLITQLPLEIITYICEYLPLQDVKNVSQILPEIYLSSVFKNWSNLQNTLNYIQEQINMIKSNHPLEYVYSLRGYITPTSPVYHLYLVHTMVTDQTWFQVESPFYVKKTLISLMRLVNDVTVFHNNNIHCKLCSS